MCPQNMWSSCFHSELTADVLLTYRTYTHMEPTKGRRERKSDHTPRDQSCGIGLDLYLPNWVLIQNETCDKRLTV
jgi:hypothetical protein